MNADEYIPCLKCDVWVPSYAKEIHMAECHELTLKAFSHPYVVGSSLCGQVAIMGKIKQSLREAKGSEERSNEVVNTSKEVKTKRKTKEKTTGNSYEKKKLESSEVWKGLNGCIEEPEWLKKILPAFHYRVVLLNEKDLIRCDISAYSPVIVKCGSVGSTLCAFLAIPDDCVRIGHVVLHQGAEKYVPSLRNGAQLWIKKIDRVEFVDELTLVSSKLFSHKESSFFAKQMKSLLYDNFPLGSPFTLNIGSRIYFPCMNGTEVSFVVQSYKTSESFNGSTVGDREFGKDMQKSSTNMSESIPSQLITIDECDCTLASAADRMSRLEISDSDSAAKGSIITDSISMVESNDTKLSHAVRTSTPKKSLSYKESCQCSPLSSRIGDSDVPNFGGHVSGIETLSFFPKSNPWFRIGKNTKVIFHPENVKKDDFNMFKTTGKDGYCKNKTYYVLKKMMESAIRDFHVKDNPLLGGWSGVLLFGPPGVGKTLMVHQAAAELNIPVVTLTLASILGASGSAEECVQRSFKTACESAPSVLFLDEVESLCPAGEQKIQANKALTPAILRGIQTLQNAGKPVLLVAATCRQDGVASKLRSSGRLDREVMVPLPDGQQRCNMFHHLISSYRHGLTEKEITDIAKKAYGFSGADLSVLLRCAWLTCVERIGEEPKQEDAKLSRSDVLLGMQSVVPTMLRHSYSAVSLVKWSDIWGYQEIKTKLQTMIKLHTSQPEKYPLKGVLLYGPPGCSKTMFVRALVHETSFSFFPLKCSSLLSKYVGETEKSLSKVFVQAQQAAPSVIFMDEIDSLCGERGGSGGLVSELLSLMAQVAIQNNVVMIGATNRPHAVDEALLRPGFLEQVIHVDLPDFDSRSDIWRGMLESLPQNSLLDIAKLSKATAGYSGAEITAVYQEAALAAVDQYIKKDADHKQDSAISENHISVNEDLLLKTIASIPPRTPVSLLESIASFSNQRKEHCFKKII